MAAKCCDTKTKREVPKPPGMNSKPKPTAVVSAGAKVGNATTALKQQPPWKKF